MRQNSRSVMVFAGAPFEAPLWTNRQQIATRLAERGWRVLYVEPRFLLWRMLCGRVPGRSGRWAWLRRQVAPQRVATSLWVQAQANLLPGSRRFPAIGRFNHWIWNAWHVRLHAWELGFRDSALLLYDTEAAEFLDDFPRSRVVYDCVDDHRAEAVAHGRDPSRVEREEAAIVARAVALAVTTEPLRQHFARQHPNVQLVPNAADIEAFSAPHPEPEDTQSIPHPRIGTVGALDAYKIDVELLAKVVQTHPEWQFVFVGPVDYGGVRGQESGARSLAQFPNVHFLGPKPREQVPAYVHAFNVAIIPYRESAYNRASFPLKFWEFMAAGKPVVASGLPSLAPYRHLATLVTTATDFSRGIAEALPDSDERRRARVAEAKDHSWETRAEAIEKLLRPA